MSHGKTYRFEDTCAMRCKLEKAVYVRGQAAIVGLRNRWTVLPKLLKFFLPADFRLKNFLKKTRPAIILLSCLRDSVQDHGAKNEVTVVAIVKHISEDGRDVCPEPHLFQH